MHKSRLAFFDHIFVFSCYLSVKTYLLGDQKNRLIEPVLFSTHNMCFYSEIRKLNVNDTLSFGGLYSSQYIEVVKKLVWSCGDEKGHFESYISGLLLTLKSKCNQEMPQSHTVDQTMTQRGRDIEH